MQVLFLKDHGEFHCGCRAVSSFIREEFGKLGQVHTIWPHPGKDPDLIVVNGEGSFNHNYGGQYLRVLDQYPGVKKVLVNSLWQDSDGLVPYLKQFDYLSVRETQSEAEMIRHGYYPEVYLDFSYYARCHVEPSEK